MQASARLSSSAAFRKVIAGVSSATIRSCYRTSRGKAHAAPLPAQEPPQKGQKRLTKQERRVRVMEYIENYRASNDGKFPTAKNIRRHVGGSHYKAREVLQEMKYNLAKLPLDDTKAPPLQDKVDQFQGTFEFPEHSRPKDDSGRTAKHDLDTSKSCKTADSTTLSDQTESDHMKVLTDKSDPGNQQREIEANKFDLNSSEKFLNASDLNSSDQSGSDIVIEGKTHSREDNPKLEESANTGLLGSLKSFAYGIRNFWKNM